MKAFLQFMAAQAFTLALVLVVYLFAYVVIYR